jgi:hypothetical protein
MTTEEEFEKWWMSIRMQQEWPTTTRSERRLCKAAYFAATQRTARRCMEISEAYISAESCSYEIKREFGLCVANMQNGKNQHESK